MRQTHNRGMNPPIQPTQVFLSDISAHMTAPSPVANLPAGLAHDARNVLAAMDIYCELLSGPGVLNPQYLHLADELRLLRESSSGLMDRLLILAIRPIHTDQTPLNFSGSRSSSSAADLTSGEEGFEEGTVAEAATVRKNVTSVAAELFTSHPMLSALAGPKVEVHLATDEAPEGPLRIASADFTRVLINLVRNAAEAMGTGGRILISAARASSALSPEPAILLSVEDNGPGIPLSLLERIFDLSSSSYTAEQQGRRMSFRPRGLGLRIVRELVESGGGVIRAARLPERGSRFDIVLPFAT